MARAFIDLAAAVITEVSLEIPTLHPAIARVSGSRSAD